MLLISTPQSTDR